MDPIWLHSDNHFPSIMGDVLKLNHGDQESHDCVMLFTSKWNDHRSNLDLLNIVLFLLPFLAMEP